MITYLTAFLSSVLFARTYEVCSAPVADGTLPAGDLRHPRRIGRAGICFISVLLAFLPVWFITAFRYGVGTDYFYVYVPAFEVIGSGAPVKWEPLFIFMNRAIAAVGGNYPTFFALAATMTMGCLYIFFFRYCRCPSASIALFFVSGAYFHSLNNVRQYIAMGFALLGLFSRRPFVAIPLIVFGALFHYAAVLYLAVYLVMLLPLGKKGFRVCTAIGIALSPLLALLGRLLLERTKYAYFLKIDEPSVSFMTILLNIGALAIVLGLYDGAIGDAARRGAYLQVFAVMMCVLSVVIPNEELWVRSVRLLSVPALCLLPDFLMREARVRIRRLLLAAVLAAFTFYIAWTVVLRGGQGVLPYDTIFGKDVPF